MKNFEYFDTMDDYEKFKELRDYVEKFNIVAKNMKMNTLTKVSSFIKFDEPIHTNEFVAKLMGNQEQVFQNIYGIGFGNMVIVSKNLYKNTVYNTENTLYNFIRLQHLTERERYSLLNLVKDRLIYMFCNYDFQKDFLEKNPKLIKEIGEIGYAPGIEEEFDHLINTLQEFKDAIQHIKDLKEEHSYIFTGSDMGLL